MVGTGGKVSTNGANGRVPGLTLFDRNVYSEFFHPGEVVEVRTLGVFGKSQAWGGDFAKGTVCGYFDDHASFCRAVTHADKSPHSGIYFTLQVIDPRLIGRAFNRLKPTNITTSNPNVIAYRWLPVDIDPIRPSGISSSGSELSAAIELRDVIATEITKEMALPAPIKAVSGNGGHLLFRLPDLPVDKKSEAFIKRTLTGLSERFDTDTVKVDTTVYNPARIWKLYGTTAKKGDAVTAGKCREARPHRIAYIESMGDLNG